MFSQEKAFDAALYYVHHARKLGVPARARVFKVNNKIWTWEWSHLYSSNPTPTKDFLSVTDVLNGNETKPSSTKGDFGACAG